MHPAYKPFSHYSSFSLYVPLPPVALAVVVGVGAVVAGGAACWLPLSDGVLL